MIGGTRSDLKTQENGVSVHTLKKSAQSSGNKVEFRRAVYSA